MHKFFTFWKFGDNLTLQYVYAQNSIVVSKNEMKLFVENSDGDTLFFAPISVGQYNMSPRGWVTFVDKGEESLMLFKVDPYGNARYQLPGDTFQSTEKLMDIRRHNRMR